MAGPALMSISNVPSLIMLTNKRYFLFKKKKQGEIDPDLPVSVQESPAEAWVDGGLLQG